MFIRSTLFATRTGLAGCEKWSPRASLLGRERVSIAHMVYVYVTIVYTDENCTQPYDSQDTLSRILYPPAAHT